MKKENNSAQNANKSAKRKRPKSKRGGNIWNMQCPKCDSDEAIVIEVLVWADVCFDGVEPGGERMWTDSSPCHCGLCGHFGKVRKFRTDANPKQRIRLLFHVVPDSAGR
jgi:hypothetical protein